MTTGVRTIAQYDIHTDATTARTDTLTTAIDALKRQREQLIAYLTMKTESADWHGVADAAMDLREIEAKLSVLNAE